MVDSHIALLILPVQGAINPSLQFAKHLARIGVKVTIVTSVSAYNRISKTSPNTSSDLTFVSFSDGFDQGFKDGADDPKRFRSEFINKGSKAIADLVTASAERRHPVTCLVYTMLQHWVAEVAREFHLPHALLWTQPATILGIYYLYFRGYGDSIRKIATSDDGLSCQFELPGLPKLSSRDLPSFLVPSNNSNMNDLAQLVLRELIETVLEGEDKSIVLVNTFDALESEALRAIEKLSMIPIGPLVPSAFLDENFSSDNAFGGDFFEKSIDYVEWLDSKPQSSVVYVSFGTRAVIPNRQMEEIARGLAQTNRPFLWVVRGEKEEEDHKLLLDGQQGMIVPWCSQLEVLSHPSLGCFVTHCGWNSSLESLVSGVPVVGFPQFLDQPTNAKLIEDVFETGVRVRVNEEGIVDGDEIKRCIEMAIGGAEMKRNAMKWRELAKEAGREGGSLDRNIWSFVCEIEERSKQLVKSGFFFH